MENLPANTNNANFLARTTAILLQRRVRRHTTAQHRRCHLTWDLVWNVEDKVGVSSPILRIAALSDIAVGVLHSVGLDELVGAVVLDAFGAHLAIGLETGIALSADADAIAFFDRLSGGGLCVLADADGLTDDLTRALDTFRGAN
jgi:hypothetical protein